MIKCGAALSSSGAACFPWVARPEIFRTKVLDSRKLSELAVRCVVASLSIAEQIPKAA